MYDLTGFQRDLLYVVAGQNEPHGLAIKDELENALVKDFVGGEPSVGLAVRDFSWGSLRNSFHRLKRRINPHQSNRSRATNNLVYKSARKILREGNSPWPALPEPRYAR
jgi:hypothetical protein